MANMRISVEITEAQRHQLEEASRQLGVPIEQLASAAIGDLLAHDQSDFDSVISRILEKNRELYRRLA
jgi:hypothetical protein